MSATDAHIQRILDDLQTTDADRNVVSKSIIASARRLKKSAPTQVQLASAILDIQPESHIKGSGVLKVTIADPGWVLMDSGFFSSSNRRGELDPIDVNYPDGSRFWWRLNTFSWSLATRQIVLTFYSRVAKQMMDLKGPMKASRSRRTRAEFIQSTVRRVPGAEFHCQQLHVKQPIDPAQAGSLSTASGVKSPGIGANYTQLKVKGAPMTGAQASVANKILQAANQMGSNEIADTAAIYAAIWESALNESADNGTYWGAFSARHDHFKQHDTVGMTRAFLGGDLARGYEAGGAIALSRTTSNPVEIAVRVEAPSTWPANAYATQSGYPGDAAAVAEARAIVQGGGGSAAGGDLGPGQQSIPVEYFFEIGTQNDPNESLWSGDVRMAGEVNWEFFVDGDRVYYDSDKTLIRQKIALVVDRDDDILIDGSFDWDSRNIATNLTIVLAIDPFLLRAGEVVQLRRLGAASECSTAGRPGCWLITDIVPRNGKLIQQLTLAQPTSPKREPAPQTTSVSTALGGGVTVTGGTGNAAEDTAAAGQKLSALSLPYIWGGGHSPGDMDNQHPSGLDCSGTVCWALHQAGLFPQSAAWVSGQIATSWGQPGEGSEMTVWANSGHTFIEFKLPQGHFQLNTSGLGPGPRYGPWGGAGATDAAGGLFTPRHWPGS